MKRAIQSLNKQYQLNQTILFKRFLCPTGKPFAEMTSNQIIFSRLKRSSEKAMVELPFCGAPYMLGGYMHRLCHQGKDQNIKGMQKYQEKADALQVRPAGVVY